MFSRQKKTTLKFVKSKKFIHLYNCGFDENSVFCNLLVMIVIESKKKKIETLQKTYPYGEENGGEKMQTSEQLSLF